MSRSRRTRIAGFTLVEALIATLLMGMVLTALATVTVQWLPNWNRGFARVQRTELLAVAIERLAADFAAVEFIPPDRKVDRPLFEGTELSATFVRSALGPNARSGLDVVRIAETADRQGPLMVRSRAAFRPGSSSTDQIFFGDPVVLLRSPYRLSFAYAGKDGAWQGSWHDASALPSAVRLTIRDAATGQVLPLSTVAVIHANLSADCVSGDCADRRKKTDGSSEASSSSRNTTRSD